MKIPIAGAALVALALAGCAKPTHEQVLLSTLANMNGLAAVLEGVTDKASAEEAIPKIESLLEEREDLRLDMAAIGDPTEAHGEMLVNQYRDRIVESSLRLGGAIENAEGHPTAGPVLAPVLQKLRDHLDRF